MVDERAIRVFVSSTFRDMQLERDELVKRVFPQIRRLCEQRGVSWSEVDLRWGVTDEQKAEGDVLPICLAEIERTRPYFIGLLGQRYGWVPDGIPAALATELGWLSEDAGRSVTELEILHGVLNDPAAPGHAFFYLRDPAWVDALAAEQRSTFVEEAEEGQRRLAELRERIRASRFPSRDYGDPIALGDQVLADLTALVESLYPDPTPPDPLARAASIQRAYGSSRFGVFVERPRFAARLDELANDGGAPLLVTGPSGIGASALVTHWADTWTADHPDTRVIVHHVEADSDAADHRAMVRRIVAELAGAHDPEPMTGDTTEAPAAVRSMLRQAFSSTSGRTVVVIDGVDRLDDVDGAPDLRWLPDEIPPNVRLVLTASAARPRAQFAHRGWPQMELEPLDDDERRSLAIRFLAGYAKGLDTEHLDALAGAAPTGNPRFLRVVLDELRQHGDHFTLGAVIADLCSAATIDDLLEKVFARYETDFERDRPGLTRDVFTSLWAARRGLSEAELLALMGDGDAAPLPQASWAPLHLAAEGGLVSRGGLLGLAHADLVKAVEDRYLPDDEARRQAHARLAEYFARRPLGVRVADELGWQQADAGQFEALRQTLSDLEFLEFAYVRSAADVRRLWARLEAGAPSERTAIRNALQPVVDDPSAYDQPPEAHRQLVWAAARLLADDGHRTASLSLLHHLVEQARKHPAGRTEDPGGRATLRAALVNLGAAQWAAGALDEARATLGEAVELCRVDGDRAMLASALGNLAMVERDLGAYDVAAAHFAEEEQLCLALDDQFELQASLGNQVQLLRTVRRLDEAIVLADRQVNVCRSLADEPAVARALATKATMLADRGDVHEAIELTESFADSARIEGDRRGLAEALLNLSVMHTQLGAADRSAVTIAEAETVARELGQPDLLGRILVSRSTTLGVLGQWSQAEQVGREAELTAREAGLDALAAQALTAVGTARRELGDLAGARAAHTDELAAGERLGDRLVIATAQTNLGNVAIGEQRFDEMFERYAIAERLLNELDIPASLVPLLANRGQVNQAMSRPHEAAADFDGAAMAAARSGHHQAVKQWGDMAVQLSYQLGDVGRAERLWGVLATAARATADDAGLQLAVGEHALLLINRSQSTAPSSGRPGATGDQNLLDEAMALLDEQEAICRRTNNDVGLASCVGNKAIVLRYRGDLAGSLACLDEQLAIATRSANAQGALFATANRGEVLGLLGRTAEAIAALDGARRTATQYGMTPMVQQLDQMIAALRNCRG